jgi:hypothetical protein
MKTTGRREFLFTTAITGVGLSLIGSLKTFGNSNVNSTNRVGIIGLDTSHSAAFAKTLNSPESGSTM